MEEIDTAIAILRAIRATLIDHAEEAHKNWVTASNKIQNKTVDHLSQHEMLKLDNTRRDVLLAVSKIAGFDLAIKALEEVASSALSVIQ